MLDFSVVNIEGLEENLSYAGCYITVDNSLIDVITPLTQSGLESSIKIPESGKLHLIIKNMREGDKLIGSVSIPISNLSSSPQWLPLFDSLEYDSVQNLPEKVELPRIQVKTHQNIEQCSNFLNKIKSLQLKIMDLEHTLASERWEFQREIGSLSSSQRYREDSQALVIEQQKLQIEKQELLINDLIQQKSDSAILKERENSWKVSLESSVSTIRNEYEKILKKSQDRDSEYLAKISEVSKENFELKTKTEKLINEIFQKDLVIAQLKEKNHHMATENYELIIKKLREKVSSSQEHLKSSEDSRNTLQGKIEELIEKIDVLNHCKNCEKNEDLVAELTRQGSLIGKETRINSSLSFDSFNDIDSQIKALESVQENKVLRTTLAKIEKKVADEEFIDSELRNFGENFRKISTGQYIYNNSVKVNIFLDNNVIFCRVGKLMTINDFFLAFSQNSNTKTCENCTNFSKYLNEIQVGNCENSWSEEDKKEGEAKKKENKNKGNVVKAQFRPDKKSFVPLRQGSAHAEKKRMSK